MAQPTCWIVYNGNLPQKKFMDFAEWTARAAEKKGITPSIIKNNELLVSFTNGKSSISGRYENSSPDFVIFGDKDVFLAKQLEKLGIPVYNSADSIEICDNKSRMYQTLADHGIPFPKTIIAPKVFGDLHDYSHYPAIVKEIGFPMVIKEAFGSFGMQVHLAENEQRLLELMRTLKNTEYVFQEMVGSSYGRDVRINIVDGKAVACMLRRSESDFRANVSFGGKTEPYTPTEEQVQLAAACAEVTGTAFAGVDLLFGPDGSPLVCEINSNAHIRSIYECTGIDVALPMMDFILDDLKRRGSVHE
ncbi:ATP-grasp domain-containing protein [Fictibacillus terranigra]|uniref:RimK family alpha-L-glutamate ligase n=1 Tax=Fictibacillus terranigra TaxID=3058424 RepID=A0ABT8E487_9BACL|nr:RimK family alpha-L-glutamate ligase [Fictibacillus sp. CENA-BCM004]MDN4072722.1 RimK family alpha-L-glutamate ligase [Fictibacillus sp. CENA-BCM004]